MADVAMLQYVRHSATVQSDGDFSLASLDNQQAWIESRLFNLRSESADPILQCSIIAATITAYVLFSEIWQNSTIPCHLSGQLLVKLQQDLEWPGWEDCADLLLWTLSVGHSNTVNEERRSAYAALIYQTHWTKLYPYLSSREVLVKTLDLFVWPKGQSTPLDLF
jgi:hypothetical protein